MLYSSHAAKSQQILHEKTPQALKLNRSFLKLFYPFVQILDQPIRAQHRCCKFIWEKGVNKKNVILRCLSSGRRQKEYQNIPYRYKMVSFFFFFTKLKYLALVSKGWNHHSCWILTSHLCLIRLNNTYHSSALPPIKRFSIVISKTTGQ